MADTNEYILNAIRHWVLSGYYDPEAVQERIEDILEDGADEEMLRASVDKEFAAKEAAEMTWPDQTDCDRLDEAFAALDDAGIIALSNAGYTMSDGISDVGEVLHERGRSNVRGYCFFHGQDVERAIDGGGLMIAFGDLDDAKAAKAEIGNVVKQMLEGHGFRVEWNGDCEARLKLPVFDWKRRLGP